MKADKKDFYTSITEKVISSALELMSDKVIKAPKENVDIILKANYQIATSLGTGWVQKNFPLKNSMGASKS